MSAAVLALTAGQLRVGEAALAAMTFPHYRPLLADADAADLLALAVMRDGQPCALLLARRGEATLLSLFVAASQRRQGLARRLLAALEQQLARGGGHAVATAWMDNMPAAAAFAALLRDAAWAEPQPRMVLYRAELSRLAQADWLLGLAGPPAGHAIVPWSGLAAGQLATLRQAVRFEAWVPPDLVPFDFAGAGLDGATAEPRLALAYTVWGEVVGWNLAHRLDADTVRASCTFVRPELQQQLLMLSLWRAAFGAAAAAGYRTVSWAVARQRTAMLAFNDRFMTPYLAQRSESWASGKRLAPPDEGI